ncbi:unnamed protein product [Blepharisma stoltei]|uniref:CMP/dCMP-type deaminase domain-containing protein n=1 Tax=Blepharisma stoltei TaxID=1481888 RepID=A0AAU9JJ94_9CILI|nr:unnamed protein product [Blepharisma stoltei]
MKEYLPYCTSTKPTNTLCKILIIDAQKGTETIKMMGKKFPLEQYSLNHLKRAKKHTCGHQLELVIGPSNLITDEEAEELKTLGDGCNDCDRIIEKEVPQFPAYTREQLKIWNSFWPISYKEPSILPIIQIKEEMKKIFEIMKSLDHDSAAIYNPKTEEICYGKKGDLPLQHPIMDAINNFPISDNQYYCNDHYLITKVEPCLMCGMALVHSRFERVYFMEKMEDGAYSYWRLHEKPLNYMYRVLRIKKNVFDENNEE